MVPQQSDGPTGSRPHYTTHEATPAPPASPDPEVGLDPEAGPPNAARMYDYYLGGNANFATDRTLAEQVIARRPELPAIARANRAFLGRAVRFLLSRGIVQFLDLGSGIPTRGNVHEIAHRTRPDARIVYVDHEPIAVAYGRALLENQRRVSVVQADLRDPEVVLREATGQLDFTAPVAVLAVACLHFVPDDDDPAEILARYRAALAVGSHLVLTHGTADQQPPGAVAGTRLYQHSNTPITLRPYPQVAELLAGFTALEPGVVFTPQWRPGPHRPRDEFTDHPERAGFYAAVARLDSSPKTRV